VNVNVIPSAMVKANPANALSREPSSSLWCAHVTVTPEDRSVTVLNRGTVYGLGILIPIGGHIQPISGPGDKAVWKNAQKNPTKNIASDIRNKTIPMRSPRQTYEVWCPRNVLSRTTSRHQRVNVYIIATTEITTSLGVCS